MWGISPPHRWTPAKPNKYELSSSASVLRHTIFFWPTPSFSSLLCLILNLVSVQGIGAMLINFSSVSSTCPPSSSSSTYFSSRLSTSRSPYLEFPLKPRTHLVKSPSLSVSYSSKTKLLSPTNRIDFRSCALPGLDFGNVESVLEAAGVLSTIIVVHETGHFLAAYLQGIRVSKFAVGFGPILAKFNANDVEFSLRAFPLGGFVGFPDNDPGSDIPEDDENLLKNRPILDRVIVISAGVVANIIFAYAIIFTQVLSVGLPVQEPFSGVLV